ncbi:glucoamylase family protein [Actinotalea solisilvae]|uniref:glucoamylase family protein n=1 Tax=Actinotalea solisilvae TaxID=2072922 RepID=UPI0018F2324F|nr:glucoamylase family protein [Actinotalea solisilvae]
MTRARRARTAALATVALAATGLLALPTAASAGGGHGGGHGWGHGGGDADRATLYEYAADTWASFEAMAHPDTGLPADNVAGDLDPASRSGYTSPTNIGAYLWSTVVARELGLIDRREARDRLTQTLGSVATLERHDDSGMFYNWYSEATGEKLRVFPTDGGTVYPFLSSVDNAWLATALVLVGNAEPRLRDEADAIRSTMDFGFFYDPAVRQLRGGFWDEPPADTAAVVGNYRDRGPDVWYTGHHYGTLNTEPRMASYLGIAWGQIPPEHYFSMFRTFPDACDWSWPEQRPVGETRTYLGVDVYEGAYRYRDMQLVPTWGGSMFEALMVDLFVPEAEWGPQSWGVNHPLTVRAHIEHGMEEAGYGYWGFSPASDPRGGYREYGVDAIGMDTNGYTSDHERTSVDPGWDDPACFRAPSIPTEYGDGTVTAHASFLALPYAHDEAMDNLAKMRTELGAYGPGGFYDSVAVRSGIVAERYLSLDQGMIMAALGNELRHDAVQRYTVQGPIRQAIRPLLAMEEFSAAG